MSINNKLQHCKFKARRCAYNLKKDELDEISKELEKPLSVRGNP
uniref:Uncharacterized protein n=1 Tax=Arundo donax TaxID=35708 RepID=A0A0A8ZA75_ARUDO